MTDTNYISIEHLYSLFTETNIIELNYIDEKKKQSEFKSKNIFSPTKIGYTDPTQLSPFAKAIYDASSPSERTQLLIDLKKDDDEIEKSYLNQYIDDPDYQDKLAHNKFGFYMESYISYFALCPVCGENTLRLYEINNLPVVDAICINKTEEGNTLHLLGPRIYQIKVAINDSNYFGKDYVLAGSKRFGYNSHVINNKEHDPLKNTVTGYICISVNTDSINTDKDTFYKINYDKSYTLIPIFSNKEKSGYFYTYDDTYKSRYKKNKIIFNPKLVRQKKLIEIMNISLIKQEAKTLTINTNNIFLSSGININPFTLVAKKLFVPTPIRKPKEKHRINIENIPMTRSVVKQENFPLLTGLLPVSRKRKTPPIEDLDKNTSLEGGNYYKLYNLYKYLYLKHKYNLN
jgi:hypothetical protein